MPITLAAVATFARGLPGATTGEKWGHQTWMVGTRGFAWERPLSKADRARYGDAPLPRGDLVAIATANLDAKDALLALELPGFFTIPHFNNYPAVLVELRLARAADVRAAIVDAHAAAAAAPPRRARARRPRAHVNARSSGHAARRKE